MSTTHPHLHRFVSPLYGIPGAKAIARWLLRSLIQKTRLPKRRKQQLYNFFSRDVISPVPLSCTVETPVQGPVSLRLDLRDDLSRQWYFWGYQGYEPGIVRLLSKLAPDKSCIFDIGANIGYYTVLLGAAQGPGCRLHAFEPHPHIAQLLADNVARSGLQSVYVHQGAISDRDGPSPLYIPEDGAWTNASLLSDFRAAREAMTVQAWRIDSFCTAREIPSIDLLKIDAEGAELAVLEGMGSLLDQWQPDIVLEVLAPYEVDLEAFFRERPYRKFLITEQGLVEQERIVAHADLRDYYLTTREPTFL